MKETLSQKRKSNTWPRVQSYMLRAFMILATVLTVGTVFAGGCMAQSVALLYLDGAVGVALPLGGGSRHAG